MTTALLIIVVLVAAFLAYVVTRPDQFRVARSAEVNAPPGKVLPLIADFHAWTAWSPYENLDPGMKRNYAGAASGKGALYDWEGNNKIGKGRMEITESSPAAVVIK